MRYLSLAAVLTVSASALAQVPQGFFEFPLLWNDTSAGVITDVSSLNHTPAGKFGHVISRDGHFFLEQTNERIRFLGANMGADEAFPTKEDAELIARRLAKAGVNIVRLHHLDNPWAIQSGGSIWDAKRPDRQEFDPTQLDKLDYLIHCLKQQGIYTNLNLKVSKELQPADGMPESIKQVKFTHQKRIDIFQKRMIELQKDYARKLLSHRNPYTKLTYAEDPAVAMVEINNENSLLGFWTSTLGKGLETLPEPFVSELRDQWTQWLRQKYSSDQQLADAWIKGVDTSATPLLSPQSTWQLEAQGGSAMTFDPKPAKEGFAPDLNINIAETGQADWHLQAKLENLDLKEGQLYTIRFTAFADRERNITVNVTKQVDDWHNMGFGQSFPLTTRPQEFTNTFKAQSVSPNQARLAFVLGQSIGTVTLQNIELISGTRDAGLKKGESLATGISIPTTASERQWNDWIHFLVDTERSFADQMRSLLKDELKVKANVAMTQLDYGGTTGLHREQQMEFADAHAYWQHPSFPGNDWNPATWTIKNTPQVAEMNDRSFGELGNISRFRVAGKPFTVSEYDHPAPSDYMSEMMPTYATYACVQDWDIIYTFATSTYSSKEKPNRIYGYFDQNNNPAKWSQYPAAALIFRKGLIEPAKASATLHFPEPIWESYHMFPPAWSALVPEGPTGFLTRRLSVSDKPLPAGEKPRLEEQGTPAPTQVRVEQGQAGKVYIAAAPKAVSFVGYIGGQQFAAGEVSLSSPAFANNFAAVTAVSTDDQPLASSKRILLTVCGQVHNQGITWNADRTSIGADWGHGPTVAQFIPATIQLPVTGQLKAYALDSTGKRVKEAATKLENGKLTLTCDMADATLLYEIVE